MMQMSSPTPDAGAPLAPDRVRAATEMTRSIERVRRMSGEIWSRLEEETGLSPSQSAALEAVADGARQVREVADACRQHVSSASRLVDSLVTADLVTRVEDPDDRRAVRLSLTGAGRDAAERITDFQVRMLARILAALDPDEADQLSDLLGRFADAAERVVLGAGTDERGPGAD